MLSHFNSKPNRINSSKVSVKRNIQYLNLQSSTLNSSETTYDLYIPNKIINNTVNVYIHGGGLTRGDKQNTGKLTDLFQELGSIFLSSNYPLNLPNGQTKSLVEYQLEALSCLHRHLINSIQQQSIFSKSTRICYIAHSAGAYLISLGIAKDIFNHLPTDFVLVDSSAYFLQDKYDQSNIRARNQIDKSCGVTSDSERFRILGGLSPGDIISSVQWTHPNPSNVLFISGNGFKSRSTANRLLNCLNKKGFSCTHILTEYSHRQINRELGTYGNQASEPLIDFLKS